MSKVEKYKGHVIFREHGALTNTTYHSALSDADYDAAHNHGEFRIPYHETSRKAIKQLIDQKEVKHGKGN